MTMRPISVLASLFSDYAAARMRPSKPSILTGTQFQKGTAALLILLMLTMSLPSSIAAQVVREQSSSPLAVVTRTWTSLSGWLRKARPQITRRSGEKPRPAETKSEKEARLARLEISPNENVVVQSQQPIWFTAVPFDAQGSAIHGLAAEWESNNKEVLFIKKTGQAVAGKPGTAILTARAGSRAASIQVKVKKGNGEKFGGKKTQNSTRQNRHRGQQTLEPETSAPLAQATILSKLNHVEGRRSKSATRAPVPMRDPDDDALPDNETGSLYTPDNVIGSPRGQTKPGAQTPAVATNGTETNGSKNFTFALPLVSLPGRGLNASVSLVYNSAVWNKSTDPSTNNTWMTYDVDSSWPAAGWRMTLGQIDDQGTNGFTLTDADGTRHALVSTSTSNYDTTDGSFIHYTGGNQWGSLFYPDGTIVTYGAGGTNGLRLYPTQITDRNGNYIIISYVGGVGPKIASIYDTLRRYVYFYYASNGDLVAITQPGLGTSDVQTARFYYTDVTLGSGLFASGIHVDGPSSIHTLDAIYLPSSSETSGSHLGYEFGYSAYGMIRDIIQYRGMTADSASTSSPGTVSVSGAIVAAQTTYSYPTSAEALTDVPAYSTRTDDWAGRTTSSAPAYSFSNTTASGEKIFTVTSPAPDSTIVETHTIDSSGEWNDGFAIDTYVKAGSTTYAQTHYDWERDSNNLNPRVSQVRNTDSLAGLTTATVLSYTTYNNVSAVSERDFTTNGSVGSEIRRTETTYVDSSSYINRHLLHLPASVKVFPANSTTAPVSRVDYAYDQYGTSHSEMTPRNDIIQHSLAYDPFQETQENCDWECVEWGYLNDLYQCIDTEWVCHYTNPYDSATDYRGNVTGVTKYADAANGSGAVTHSMTYDIAGNLITADVDCCQQKSFTYSGEGTGQLHDYAYVVSTTRGTTSGLHLTASATYDSHTGLLATSIDENNRTTTNYYNTDSLRLEHVTYPDGGATYLTYSDALADDRTYIKHSYVDTSTKLDNGGSGGATRYISRRQYFDGRGAVARTMIYAPGNGWSTQDVEYDEVGRAYRVSNPYYASDYSATPLTSSNMFWSAKAFDHLGRVTEVKTPRGDNNNTNTTSVMAEYTGVFMTITDGSAKQRRQKVDALGRVIRLDEPTSSGLGSTTSPNQPTSYYYDLLDNLVRINQSSQNRYYKYDSLSRPIYERQVEQDAPHYATDSLTSNNYWSRKIIYNSSGRVTDSYDARNVHTNIEYDSLNRVTQIQYLKPSGGSEVAEGTPTAHYFYDSQSLPSGAPTYSHDNTTGRLLAMTYGSSTSITGNYFAYDEMGRIKTQKQVTGSTAYSLSYTYNYAGLLIAESYPSTRGLTHTYDDGGRLLKINDASTIFVDNLAYEAHGGLNSETWGNSAVHELTYNRRLQSSQLKLRRGSDVLQQYDYDYGEFNSSTGNVDISKNNGQIGKITATIGSTAQWNQGFRYDEVGRLSSVVEHQGSSMTTSVFSQSYAYDVYGNRQQDANTPLGLLSAAASDYDTTANRNRFVSSVASYDEAGNITQDSKFRSLKYAYDANGRQRAVKALNDTELQSSVYDCAGMRVKTVAGSITRTMVYDIFGQNVADYLGTNGVILERENIYRGGQLLATDDTPPVSAPSALSGSLSGSNIQLTWTAASGATNYRVERKTASGSFTLKGTTTGTSLTDSTNISANSAYLYKVCAADDNGACLSAFSNVALATTISFSTDPTICGSLDSPSCGTPTGVKHEHVTELRAAVNAVRALASKTSITTPNPATGDPILASDVRTLRDKLGEALSSLGIYNPTFTDPLICGSAETSCGPATTIKAAHVRELRTHCTGGSSCYKSIETFINDAYMGVLGRPATTGSASEMEIAKASLTHAQSLGQAQLISAAQSLMNTLFIAHGSGTTPEVFVTALYKGFLQRAPDDSGYNFWLDQLVNHGDTRAHQIASFADSTEFKTNVAALCVAFGGGGGLHYVLSDLQGSARVAMNNNGSSSAVVARHDYLPFGEEIGWGVGSRTLAQGYNAGDNNRWRYGITERDDTSGLDHTPWRKYENLSGRWTSPDPIGGDNAYVYAGNDPVNLVDPSGLLWDFPEASWGYSHFANGMWGWGDLTGWGRKTGRDDIAGAESRLHPLQYLKTDRWEHYSWENYHFTSLFDAADPSAGGRLPFDDCFEFVDYLADLANVTAQNVSRNPMQIGDAMVKMTALGARMMHTSAYEYDSYGNNRFDSFKPELVAGGQNQGVYTHVLGNAGTVLVGNYVGETIAVGNHVKDLYQTYFGDSRQKREGPAELADNIAGLKVGSAMQNYIMGRRDQGRLKNELKSILCNPTQ